MRVLLDTNVLVSAFIRREGFPARILEAWYCDRFVLVTSPHIVGEIGRVSRYPRVAKRLKGREQDIANLIEEMELAAPEPAQGRDLQVLADPDDNAVLAAAIGGNADYLVTGNTHHFDQLGGAYEGLEILSPREFWERLESEGDVNH